MAMNSVTILDNSDASGLNMKQKGTNGEGHVRTIGSPGTLETITFVADAVGDLMTDPAAPVTTEIFYASGFTPSKKRVRFIFHGDGNGGVPFAIGAVVAINAGATEGAYLTALTLADNGASVTAYTSFGTNRVVSPAFAVAEYNLEGTSATVDNIGVGFLPGAGTPASTSYVTVEVW